MQFRKYHGLGNDYLVLEQGVLTPETVVAVCDRHTGLGSDGILEMMPTNKADVGLRIWNPDGSVAEKSGNGLRIFARWLVDFREAMDDISIELPCGIVRCQVDEDMSLQEEQEVRIALKGGQAMLRPAKGGSNEERPLPRPLPPKQPLLLLTYRPQVDPVPPPELAGGLAGTLAAVPEVAPVAPSPPRIEELEEWEARAGGSFALSSRTG